MDKWSDDVLLIQYNDLEAHPGERLRTLSAISLLFNIPPGTYSISTLGLRLDEWELLRAWISQGYGTQFWQIASQGIKISRVCEKHVLVGTGQLLADLRSMVGQQPSTRQLFENLWVAAKLYVVSEIIKGGEVTHG